MYGSVHDNVTVDIFSMEYNSTLNHHVLATTATIKNVPGHLEEIFNTPEGESQIHERDKSVRYRFIVKRTAYIASALVNGSVLRVLRRKHLDSNGWTPVTTGEQYIVQHITEPHSHSRFLSLGLVRQDAY
jgi:hypothetical protein